MTYFLRRSARAKYMRLSVQPGGNLVVTAPIITSADAIERFLIQHSRWIERSKQRMRYVKTLPVSGRRGYLRNKEDARILITALVRRWNSVYGFHFNRIAIKNTRRTWGSCSRKGNLNFSYALLFLPRELADYVVVHELCHLEEHNHSKRFWDLVARTLPEYREYKKILASYRL